MSQCRICKNPSNPVMNSTCEHPICYNCIPKELLYNLNLISVMEGIDKEIQLKCIICDSGFHRTSKNEIYKVLQYLPKEADSFTNSCLNHNLEFSFYCHDCKMKLCVLCFEKHKEHIIFQNYFGNKRTCTRCNEILKFQCVKCSMPCCLVCEKTLHKTHELEEIQSYYAKNHKEMKAIKLPFEDQEEFLKYLRSRRDITIESFEESCKELIRKIDGLITKLKDLVESINSSYEKKVDEIKKSYSILANVFTKINHRILTVAEDDFTNLHLLSKLPKKFLSFSMNVHTIANYEENINCIKNEIDKIKNESINYKKLKFDWEFSDYSLIKTSAEINGIVHSRADLGNGLVASGSANNIYIHNINQNFKLIKTINDTNINETTCLLLIPNNRIVLGTNKARLLVYNANDNYMLIKNIDSVHTKAVSCLEFVSKHKILACGSLDGNIKLIDSNDWESLKVLSAESAIRCLLYLPARDILLSGSDDTLIRVWDLNNDYKVIKILIGNNYSVHSLCLLKNGLFANGCSSDINIWNDEFICQKTIKAHNGAITQLKLLNNGDLVSCSLDKTFKIWSCGNFFCRITVNVGSPIYSLLTLPNNNIITGTEKKEIKEWTEQFQKI